jgi:hypothetical protein
MSFSMVSAVTLVAIPQSGLQHGAVAGTTSEVVVLLGLTCGGRVRVIGRHVGVDMYEFSLLDIGGPDAVCLRYRPNRKDSIPQGYLWSGVGYVCEVPCQFIVYKAGSLATDMAVVRGVEVLARRETGAIKLQGTLNQQGREPLMAQATAEVWVTLDVGVSTMLQLPGKYLGRGQHREVYALSLNILKMGDVVLKVAVKDGENATEINCMQAHAEVCPCLRWAGRALVFGEHKDVLICQRLLLSLDQAFLQVSQSTMSVAILQYFLSALEQVMALYLDFDSKGRFLGDLHSGNIGVSVPPGGELPRIQVIDAGAFRTHHTSNKNFHDHLKLIVQEWAAQLNNLAHESWKECGGLAIRMSSDFDTRTSGIGRGLVGDVFGAIVENFKAALPQASVLSRQETFVAISAEGRAARASRHLERWADVVSTAGNLSLPEEEEPRRTTSAASRPRSPASLPPSRAVVPTAAAVTEEESVRHSSSASCTSVPVPQQLDGSDEFRDRVVSLRQQQRQNIYREEVESARMQQVRMTFADRQAMGYFDRFVPRMDEAESDAVNTLLHVFYLALQPWFTVDIAATRSIRGFLKGRVARVYTKLYQLRGRVRDRPDPRDWVDMRSAMAAIRAELEVCLSQDLSNRQNRIPTLELSLAREVDREAVILQTCREAVSLDLGCCLSRRTLQASS